MLHVAESPARARLRPANREARAQRLSDGRLIGYADYGDPSGWPVVALHGTPGCRLMFKLADGPARERGLRLIAPDRPGYALSSPHPGRGFSALAWDVNEIADALGLDRFAVVGVSGGAPYAAACAANLRPRVAALALASPVGPINGSPALGLGPMQTFVFRHLGTLPWASTLAFHAMRLALVRTPTLCHRGLVQRTPKSERCVLMRPEVKASLMESLYEGLRSGVGGAREDVRLFAEPWDFDLGDVRAPARVWQGTADPVVPGAAAKALAKAVPGCELIWCEGAGHYWVFDHFGRVLDWLVAQRATTAA